MSTEHQGPPSSSKGPPRPPAADGRPGRVTIVRVPVARAPAPRAPSLSGLRLFPTDRGVQFLWDHTCSKRAVFHFWWATRPWPGDTWEAVADAAENHQVIQGGNSWSIEVAEDTTLFVAIGAEQDGKRVGPLTRGPIKATAPRRPAPPPPPRPPEPPSAPSPATPATCRSCGAPARPGRRFCSSCGLPLAAPAGPPTADRSAEGGTVQGRPYTLGACVEKVGATARFEATTDGTAVELIETPASSPLAEIFGAVEGWGSPLHLAHGGDVRNEDVTPLDVFPALLAREVQDGRLRVLATRDGEDFVPLADWCRDQRQASDLFGRLSRLLEQLLAGVEALHGAGHGYGLLTADRIRVSRASGQVRLAWPIEPLGLGRDATGARRLLGLVCPEHARAGETAQPHWDLFTLGVAVLWSLAGGAPPETLSDPQARLLNLRVLVPELPVGWAAFFERLLAREPARRFPDAASARAALAGLGRGGSQRTLPLRYRIAAAQHIGEAKGKVNPRNQDRAFFALPGPPTAVGSHLHFAHGDDVPNEDVTPECFVTEAVEGGPPALAGITDGVSTATAGEFAAESIMEGALEFWHKAEPAGVAPGPLVVQLFEHVNRHLGQAIRRRAEADAAGAAFLRASSSPSATLVAAAFTAEGAAVASVGDSRAYVLRDGLLDQLTVDGDQLTVYLRQGLDIEASRGRDDYRELVSWIGRFEAEGEAGSRRIVPERPRPVAEPPGYWSLCFPPREGDIYCLCSDGLSDYVDDGAVDLAGVLAAHPPAEACRVLVEAANRCGGVDNISVVVIQAVAAEAESPPTPTADGRPPTADGPETSMEGGGE